MPFQNPFSSPVFKYVGFPFMVLVGALILWSISDQTCHGYKVGLYKAPVTTSTTP